MTKLKTQRKIPIQALNVKHFDKTLLHTHRKHFCCNFFVPTFLYCTNQNNGSDKKKKQIMSSNLVTDDQPVEVIKKFKFHTNGGDKDDIEIVIPEVMTLSIYNWLK